MSRRTFIKQSAMALTAMALPINIFSATKNNPKLSFSTLGCPNWSLPFIVKFATENGYQGIEIRTILGELDLPKCPDFSKANINSTKRLIADHGLKITDLGSSTSLHHTDKKVRNVNLDEAKRFIDLAEKLDCPYVRVFPDKLPVNDTRSAIIDLITEGLVDLGTYAQKTNVDVLIESHGDLVNSDELLRVLKNTEQYGIAMIWDILNMWSITRESPTVVFKKLNKFIRHIHVKDATFVNGKEEYVLLGKGEAPIKEAVELLYKSDFNGFYSLEWEKMWHPEIEAPEIALTQYPKVIRNYFN